MRQERVLVGFLASAALAVAGCGGGGGSAPAANTVIPTSTSAPTLASAAQSRVMSVTFAGAATLQRARRAQGLSGTPVTATYKGKTVGTGTLDANGNATLVLSGDDVPRAATIVVTAGSLTVTLVLAQSEDGTAAQVQVNGDGTITVTISATHIEPGTQSPAPGSSPTPFPSATPGGENTTVTQDGSGNPIYVTTTQGALPSNLPFTVAYVCNNVTVAPVTGSFAHFMIEMNSVDGSGKALFRYEGPLSTAMTFAVIPGSLRIHVIVFKADGSKQLDLRGPINAMTPGWSPGATCPPVWTAPPSTPAPSSSPGIATAAPTRLDDSPSPGRTSSPSPTASPSASPTASPSASPSPTATRT